MAFLEAGSFGRVSPNFYFYCRYKHDADFILKENNVNGWKCKKGNQLFDINYQDLCSTQFKGSTRRGYDRFDDPASIYCQVDGEFPQKQYRHDSSFSPYSCDELGICRLDSFKFYSQLDDKIVKDEAGLDRILWNKLTYTDGLCVPTAIGMAIDTLYAQSNRNWTFSKFMKQKYQPKKEGNFAHNVRALSEFFNVPKYLGVTQDSLFSVGYLSDYFHDEEKERPQFASFEHYYPAVGNTEWLRAAMQNKVLPLVSYAKYKVTQTNENGKLVKQYVRLSAHMEVLYAFDDRDVYSVDPRNDKLEYWPFRIQKTIHCDPSNDGKSFTAFNEQAGNCFLSVIHEVGDTITALEGVTFFRLGVRKL